MDIWNRITRKTKQKEDTNKWIVYAVVIVAIIVISSCSIGLILISGVDDYLQNNKEIIHLYDFYDKKVGENETAVYFIGSSIVGYSIYPPLINEILNSNGYNITAYNLFISGDLPYERTLEIQKIIDSKPSLAVFGITYRSVDDDHETRGSFSERVNLVYDKLSIRPDSLCLFTEDDKNTLSTPPNILYFKTFIWSALSEKIFGRTAHATLNYLVDPIGIEERIYKSSQKNQAEIVEASQDPNNVWRPVVTNESTICKDALLYNVRTLQNAGIPVIIINMPLHPLFSEKVTDESRQNFFDLLNQTGAKWLDMEKDYGDEFFYDSHHAMFEEGALVFSPRMADLIIQELG